MTHRKIQYHDHTCPVFQWFGNIVSPKWWSWLWLNEAFASYWDMALVEETIPTWRVVSVGSVAVVTVVVTVVSVVEVVVVLEVAEQGFCLVL